MVQTDDQLIGGLLESMGLPTYFHSIESLFEFYDIDTAQMSEDELLNDITSQLTTVHPPNTHFGDRLMLKLGPYGCHCVFDTDLLSMLIVARPHLFEEVREEINERELARLIESGLAYPTGSGYSLSPLTDEHKNLVTRLIDKLRDLIGDEHEQTEAGPRIAPSTDAC